MSLKQTFAQCKISLEETLLGRANNIGPTPVKAQRSMLNSNLNGTQSSHDN